MKKQSLKRSVKQSPQPIVIFGGKIDYDSFQESSRGCPLEALERLAWILNTGSYDLDIGDWPLAFESVEQADRFLEDLTGEWEAWARLTDEVVEALGKGHLEGPFGSCSDPLTNGEDAARLLTWLKETFFDRGIKFDDWDGS